MLFRWLRLRRRQQLLRQPFPQPWQAVLEERFALYNLLNQQEKYRLHNDARILMTEKSWEGCAGQVVTDEMKILIAAQASYLVLGLEHDYYPSTQSILIYPDAFRIPPPPAPLEGPPQLWDSEGIPALGEARYRGPVVLSWQEVEHSAAHPEEGTNLVFHEFAHQLDMLDGLVNGTPPLPGRAEERRWRRIMSAEFRQLQETLAHHEGTLLDPQGAQNEAEFFAVATECFFNLPHELRAEHQHLYRLLVDYYRQDPAERG